jgi:hypothetical protein
MINHARTLLLNRNGASRPPADFFLEEYVPASFAALTLPGYLKTIYNTLVGETADDAWANFRMRQYTTILHSTEFASYALTLDERITYLRTRSTLNEIETRVVTPLNILAGSAYILGTILPSISQPRLLYEWKMEMTSSSTVTIRDLRTGAESAAEVTVTEGLSNLIGLTGQSDLYVRLENPVVGAAWKISVFASPLQDLTTLVNSLRQTGGATLGRLFSTSVAPYNTFKELWDKHPFLSYQLSGLLLAFIYRAEEIRVGGNS